MIKTWSCEYCGETSYFKAQRCSEHEDDCTYNPKNKTCDTCENWFWDPNNEPDGASCCKLPEFEPFKRNCDGWEKR